MGEYYEEVKGIIFYFVCCFFEENMKNQEQKYLLIGLLVGIVLMGFSVMIAGGGHGYIKPFVVLFPYVFYFPAVSKLLDPVGWLFSFFFFPLFFFLIYKSTKNRKFLWYLLVLVAFHFMMVKIVMDEWNF